MLLVGRLPSKFKSGFEEQFFRRISFDAASGNGVLKLFLLAVNTIIPIRYQLHLTCIKDEHLNM